MVKGLEIFREHFKHCIHQFVLIGGTACDLIMEEAGLEFRTTKDIDIVLCVEVIDPAFIRTFWEFIRLGKYRIQEQATGRRQFYRFMKPEKTDYPFMLELFSRTPDTLRPARDGHLTPIAVEEAIVSLSAILMDDVYYRFIFEGKRKVNGIPVVGPEHLIPLKVKAWLELNERIRQGEHIDSRNVKKHRNDIFRLSRIIQPDFQSEIPEAVRKDIKKFLSDMTSEPVDLPNLGLAKESQIDHVLGELKRIYKIDS